MAQQPSGEDIQMLTNLLNITEQEAINRLKGNNNNVDQAINEYFDAPNPEAKYGWDEALFSSDRDGTTISDAPSFSIHAPDEPGPYENTRNYDGAPSRPPSRANNKSPLSKIIDLTAEAAAANPADSMSHLDQQEREFQQAIAASRADVGLPPQETGVVGDTDKVYFGPANRNTYEDGKWDLVPTSQPSVQEFLPDPEPAQRKRDFGAPAFLKPSVEDHRLGALFTIYHEIPLIREVFLDRIDVLPNYGQDNKWWTGKAIQLPNQDEEMRDAIEVDREIQRLMAFLDKTERSYGSADVLANLPEVRKHHETGKDVEAAVLIAWGRLFESQPGLTKKIFTYGVGSQTLEEAGEKHEFAILDLDLPKKEDTADNLYDMADEALWPNFHPTELTESAYLPHVADIITIRMRGNERSKEIDVPTVWYPDRYLKESREDALEMRLAKLELEEDIHRISVAEDKLTHHQSRNGKLVKVKDLFNASLRHDEAEMNRDGTARDGLDVDMTASRPSKPGVLSAQLQKLLDSIDKKLTALNEEKEKARESMKRLSALYAFPGAESYFAPTHRYTLRGVSVTKSTTYFCRRAEPQLIDIDLDANGRENVSDQWWKINYATTGSNPITVVKSTEAAALAAAKAESRNTLLVYASDKAMDWVAKPLPAALENFVRWDNANFNAEFPKDTEEYSPTTVSSPKRKFDEHSEDSQDMSPPHRASSVQVVERELRGLDESGLSGGFNKDREAQNSLTALNSRANGADEGDVIMGIDPTLLSKDGEAGQEMSERSGMPMLSRSSAVRPKVKHDSMDLDQVVEDADQAEESGAVQHVGLKG